VGIKTVSAAEFARPAERKGKKDFVIEESEKELKRGPNMKGAGKEGPRIHKGKPEELEGEGEETLKKTKIRGVAGFFVGDEGGHSKPEKEKYYNRGVSRGRQRDVIKKAIGREK